MIGPDLVLQAGTRIAPHVHRTPVLTCSAFDTLTGARVAFKCENFQRTGSFKFRGACNAVAALCAHGRPRGVIAHSSGNHAQALALAARMHGIPAHVVMPENAPALKRDATAAYGASITLCAPTHRAREEAAERIENRTGATFVSAHNDPHVIAGQGTACVELIEDVGACDLILAPVGGGGLLSGTLLAADAVAPGARVVGCEPEGADDAARGLAQGKRITEFVPTTIADGLRTPLGDNTFDILREHAVPIVVVTERDIVRAMRFVWERMKIVIEPSSAVAVAPLLTGQMDVKDRRVGVILSGGNVDVADFFDALENGRDDR